MSTSRPLALGTQHRANCVSKGVGCSSRSLLCLLAILCSAGAALGQTPGRISATGGEIVITPILNSSVKLEYAGKVIYIDPWSAADLSHAAPADLILVTDEPYHHFDPKAIQQLRKPGTLVVVTATVHKKFAYGKVLENGKSGVFAGVMVQAVPAYDLTPGDPFHPKGKGNGYVITLGGKRIYFSGMTECVPEVQALKDIEVAFLPMNTPLDRMRPVPVVECLKTFKPKFVYLHHYDSTFMRWIFNPKDNPPPSAQRTSASLHAFTEALKGTGITYWDAKWYPDYPPEPGH
jgi:L-ascorbate metabolism protein UlaG (beta-lactamase superfamily)